MIKLAYNKEEKTKYKWILLESIDVVLSNGEAITVPDGLKTDLSSSPRLLWGIFPPYGDFLLAAIVHDYLYIYKFKANELGNYQAQKFADKQMLYLSNIYSKNKVGNYLRYLAVRLFGHRVWNK